MSNQIKMEFDDYDGFVKKFERKKTTDDCYTPPAVYEAVKNWVFKYWHSTQELNIVRPFYPGKDYQEYDYKPTDLVLDNPPFSLNAQIIQYYNEHNVKFFIFAPHNSLFNANDETRNTFVIVGASVIFENGANVSIDFVTNLPSEYSIILAGDLKEAIEAENPKPNVKKYIHPYGVVSSALLGKYVVRGNCYAIPRELTAMCPHKDKPFGGGFCIPPSLQKDIEELAETDKARGERERRQQGSLIERKISLATQEGLKFLDGKYTGAKELYNFTITKK